MLGALRRWRRAQTLARPSVADPLLPEILARDPLLSALGETQRARLRDLVVIFLAEKQFFGAGEFTVTDAVRVRIAAVACRVILDLGIDWYRGWTSIIVYPDTFRVPQQALDEAGVMHQWSEERAGEAWERGAVILSWADIEAETADDEYSVIIHEFAHKLDMLNGEANGCPPLHRGMSYRRWRDVMQAAFEDLCAQVERGEEPSLDPYAASGPAEFFAVASEVYFKHPRWLRQSYHRVWKQLRSFYHGAVAPEDHPTQRPAR